MHEARVLVVDDSTAMLSGLTQSGTATSLRAYELGAVECFPKPLKATPDQFAKTVGKLGKIVLTAANSNLRANAARPQGDQRGRGTRGGRMSATDATVPVVAIAKVLAELSLEIEALGSVLCSDPAFALNHVEELQAIDLISQKQRSLAHLLEADCARSALSGIGLEELVRRLRDIAQGAADTPE